MAEKIIQYSKQEIDKNDINAVSEVLNSPFITQGEKVKDFEKALAKYCNSKYVVAVSSGTAALHLINLVLNKNRKKVFTSPITFLATANSIEMTGANPDFVDIKNDDFTLNPDKLNSKLSFGKYSGIIPVHFGGVICDMEKIKSFADKNKLFVVEDACHALGGSWTDSKGNKRKVGDCSHSDATIFSFHPVKQMTTGEGGAITTNSKAIYEELLSLRSHGAIKNDALSVREGGWYYEMNVLGYNYRITDIQCALGLTQLQKLDEWNTKRTELVRRYDDLLKNIPYITSQKHNPNQSYSYHLYIIKAEKRRELYEFLKSNNIYTQVHYIPIYKQPYYLNKYGNRDIEFPESEEYYKKALSLPLFPSLTFEEQDRIVNKLKEFYNGC